MLKRPFAAASRVAPNAPTAPASDGVANPKRIDPFINVMRKTGGKKLLKPYGIISPLGMFSKLAGNGGAKLGLIEANVATKIR